MELRYLKNEMKSNKKLLTFFLPLALRLLTMADISAQHTPLINYNVKWTTPGINAQGSMPIGNGDIGANVWVDANGDILFYVSKTDAWSEIGRLLKLGRIRIRLSPNPFKENTFLQELELQNGAIVIRYGNTKISVWVDANHPVIQTDIRSDKPLKVDVVYENWRKQRRAILGKEAESVWGLGPIQISKDCPTDVFQEPDTILTTNSNRIMALHHNAYSIFEKGMQIQALADVKSKLEDPLLHRNYGVTITGDGLTRISDTVLTSSKAANTYQIQVFPYTNIGSIDNWGQSVVALTSELKKISTQKRLLAHYKWWNQFWDRSFIYITARDINERKAATLVTRGYVLQRYMNACAGRGNFPIKFNGSLFTVDTYNRSGEYQGFDADFRAWGGCYWWQNTRLPYWSMLEAGDFDLMLPLFNMYAKMLPLRMAATQKYYHHEGAFFPETVNFWGTYPDSDYGCNRVNLPDGYVTNPYIRYYWQSGLELSLMMIDYYLFLQDKVFFKTTLLPFVSQILTFNDQHWKQSDKGPLLFDPAQSLETYQTAVNPLPEIVGIKVVTEKMLAFPENLIPASTRNQWQKLLSKLPPIPFRKIGVDTLLSPAFQYGAQNNVENPELYAVFPYREYIVGKPHLNLALNTYKQRNHKQNIGWQQNPIQAAYLGLHDEAKRMIVDRFSSWDENFRFPAFFGPNYDWTPDQCHGNVAMIALQRMLLQYDNEKITLLPAWPKEWDVHFRLKLPNKKSYEGIYKNGVLVEINKRGKSNVKGTR